MTTESHLSRNSVRSRSVELDGLLLVARRTARGLNQVEAAERMKIAVSTLSLAENGRPVWITTAATIAKFYDLKVGDARDGAVALGTGGTALPSAEAFNADPASGRPMESLGVRPCPPRPGRLRYCRWRDPGGPGYSGGAPYDRPNRALALRSEVRGRYYWWEYNLLAVTVGGEDWRGPSHVWLEIDHEFPALGGNRPGLLLSRVDTSGYQASPGETKVLEFFIPDDAAASPLPSPQTVIYMRWISEPIGSRIGERDLVAHTTPFESTDFVIGAVARDP